LKAITLLRSKSIAAELYPDSVKLKKQMVYCNKRGIPYVVMVGASEIAQNNYLFKDMASGEQQLLSLEQLAEKVS
jgi:histidyl-tRNA synthetase